MTVLDVPDGPKMLRETLCVAQAAIIAAPSDPRAGEHVARLQRLINECDRHRPLGPAGKHGTRHTPTCGCEDTVTGDLGLNAAALDKARATLAARAAAPPGPDAAACCPHQPSEHGADGCLHGWGDIHRSNSGCLCLNRGMETR